MDLHYSLKLVCSRQWKNLLSLWINQEKIIEWKQLVWQ
jgi:hypothetical protein